MPTDTIAWVGFGMNLGIGGVFLYVLFRMLSVGKLLTKREFDSWTELNERRHQDKDRYIAKLEAINDKLDARNDLLAKQMEPLLEISKAHGMIEALPPSIGERIAK